LWKEKPSEWSNFYFLNNQQIEIFKSPTGLNKKSDNFWHSVYIMSNIFSDEDAVDEEIEITTQQSLDL
jgi:predicted HNH restriction endonuclease